MSQLVYATCPFCGFAPPEDCITEVGGADRFLCEGCGAMGPRTQSGDVKQGEPDTMVERACVRWNRRVGGGRALQLVVEGADELTRKMVGGLPGVAPTIRLVCGNSRVSIDLDEDPWASFRDLVQPVSFKVRPRLVEIPQ